MQGVDSDALETIIRYFYSGECPITISSAVPLLDAAIKLEVPGLMVACEQFVSQLLHPLTAVTFLQQVREWVGQMLPVGGGYVCMLGGVPDLMAKRVMFYPPFDLPTLHRP